MLCVLIINPWRMHRRVTVVVFVCVSVCLSVCSTSTRFVVDLHGPSKVPTSFKRYSLTLNNMDYAKNVLFKRYGVIYLPQLSVAVFVDGMHLQQQLDIIQTNKVDRTPE